MIEKHGQILIKEDSVQIQDFHVKDTLFPTAQIEMLEWGIERLRLAIQEFEVMGLKEDPS